MTRNVASRVDRLEERIRADGCLTCREWTATPRIEVMTAEEHAASPPPERPDRCPTCDREIPHHIQRIVITTRPGPE